jgi:hypothetical protein
MRNHKHTQHYTPESLIHSEPSLALIVADTVAFGLLCAGLVCLGLAYFDCLVK